MEAVERRWAWHGLGLCGVLSGFYGSLSGQLLRPVPHPASLISACATAHDNCLSYSIPGVLGQRWPTLFTHVLYTVVTAALRGRHWCVSICIWIH